LGKKEKFACYFLPFKKRGRKDTLNITNTKKGEQFFVEEIRRLSFKY